MPALSEQQLRARRRTFLSWIPISLVAFVCVLFVVGVIAIQNSWWTSDNPEPAADQAASDGMSVFSDPVVDYFTREGTVRVKVRSDSLSASNLGLEPDAVKTFEPLVPVSAVLLAADGAFTLDLVKAFTITTSNNRVERIELVQDSSGMWLAVYPELGRIAPAWGWTPEQLAQLQADLATASQTTDQTAYSAELPKVTHKGAIVSAEVTVKPNAGNVGLAFTIETGS